MKFFGIYKAFGLFLAAVTAATLAASPTLAHRFNVTLVLPLSGAAADAGRQFRQGFMLATTERDSHADEESDGHLGGLDVYVRVIGALGDVSAERRRGQADIVAAFGAAQTRSLAGPARDGSRAVLLTPGRLAGSGPPADFIRAYKKAYREAPSSPAAQGYNAARRIDRAVRAQGGVADAAALRQSFTETARDFTW